MISYYQKQKKGFVPSSEEDVLIIQVLDPSPEEAQSLASKYNIPLDYILSVQDLWEIPRYEAPENKAQVYILNYPLKQGNVYSVRPISFIIGQGVFIYVLKERSELFYQLFNQQEKILNNSKELIEVFLAMVWILLKSFLDYLGEIENKLNTMEKQLKSNRASHKGIMETMLDLQKSLVFFQTATNENEKVLDGFAEHGNIDNSDQTQALLHNLKVENTQVRVMVDQYTKLIYQLSDTYSNLINNNLNNTMKVLTSLTIVLTVPTIISGFWGMNVKLPFIDHPLAFWILLVLNGVLSIGLIIWLKKKNYL